MGIEPIEVTLRRPSGLVDRIGGRSAIMLGALLAWMIGFGGWTALYFIESDAIVMEMAHEKFGPTGARDQFLQWGEQNPALAGFEFGSRIHDAAVLKNTGRRMVIIGGVVALPLFIAGIAMIKRR